MEGANFALKFPGGTYWKNSTAAEIMRRFANECRTAADLTRDRGPDDEIATRALPHIVKFYPVDPVDPTQAITLAEFHRWMESDPEEASASSGNVPYLKMEWLKGQSLEDIIKDQKRPFPLDIGWAAIEGVGLVDALILMEREGVIHRDLKPGNVIVEQVDGQEILKIIDFGIAKSTLNRTNSNETTAGELLGTPYYMAPEQIGTIQAAISAKTDLYSFGMILWEMFTSELLYGDISDPLIQTLAVIMKKQQDGHPLITDVLREKRSILTTNIETWLSNAPETAELPRIREYLERTQTEIMALLSKIFDNTLALDPAKRYPGNGGTSGLWELREDLTRLAVSYQEYSGYYQRVHAYISGHTKTIRRAESSSPVAAPSPTPPAVSAVVNTTLLGGASSTPVGIESEG
jgi:serine/threonine protein kinase